MQKVRPNVRNNLAQILQANNTSPQMKKSSSLKQLRSAGERSKKETCFPITTIDTPLLETNLAKTNWLKRTGFEWRG